MMKINRISNFVLKLFYIYLITALFTQVMAEKPPYKGSFKAEKPIYQLIILMDKNYKGLDVLVENLKGKKQDTGDSILTDVEKIVYLQKDRKQVGLQKNLDGLKPEEIDKIHPSLPDQTLIHPDSTQARLQRYILLSYPDKDTLLKAKERLLKNKEVISVQEDIRGHFLATVPNDPFFTNTAEQQWGPFALNLTSAWDQVTGHAYLGLPDSGLAHNQDDLLTNFRPQFSYGFEDNDSEVFEPGFWSAHGSHVFGILSATTDNNTGVAGTCWECSIAFARLEIPYPSTVATTYAHFHDLGVQAVNSSFGTSAPPHGNSSCETIASPDALCDSITKLNERDILISAAAGNGINGSARNTATGRNNFIQFPASDNSTIAVGAIDFAGNRANFSDFGSQLDIVAPGFDIFSTIEEGVTWNSSWFCGDQFGPGGSSDGYGHCSGTSMSAPFVTGILGLMRSTDPLLVGNDVKDALLKSSSQYPASAPGNPLANGVPDTADAINRVLGTVDGNIIENRLTPLFSFYSSTAQNSFYTSVPQMGCPAIQGTLLPKPPSGAGTASYNPSYGTTVMSYGSFYSDFPHGADECQILPLAEVQVFTTDHNILNPSQPLVPLYRMSFQGDYAGNNPSNVDHVYTTEQTGINAYVAVGYALDGIEGYIYSNQFTQPPSTEKLYRMYNLNRDDHAIFPESKYNEMYAAGYTHADGGNAFIGYVYLNQDADNDGLTDGFEIIAGTCINDPDSDNDGIPDGIELSGYPRSDPLSTSTPCDDVPVASYPWQENASGTQVLNVNWNYAMGYHFTPQVNGTIDELGGLFNGNKVVKLFRKDTGQLLTQTTVSGNNNWSYNNIAAVPVQAGVTYTVAVYLAGSGASYRYGGNAFPLAAEGIVIEGSTYAYTGSNSNARPTNNVAWTAMYGQADLHFIPN